MKMSTGLQLPGQGNGGTVATMGLMRLQTPVFELVRVNNSDTRFDNSLELFPQFFDWCDILHSR